MLEREILLAALEKAQPAEREAYLKQACGQDAELRSRVDALLRASEVQDSFLEHPAAETQLFSRQTDGIRSEIARHDELSLDFLQPSDESDALGRLGHYQITEVIGRGGMGVVLKARDTKLNRVVAIKVLAPELASNPTARKRFQREAHAAAAVVHQHIVTIHAVEEDRLPYLVMECIVGQSLKEKIDREGHLQLVEILRIGQQVAAGLSAAHAHGLIHRDVKPANILLENGVERVRITDFGLARAVDDVSMTRTGEVSGTPQYMSPEQAQGHPVDGRSDLFSLGCVLYAMCTGRPPFRAESAPAVLHRICHDTPRPIQEINPAIPDWLLTIIERLLKKDPAERFQSAKEVAELLGQYLAHAQQPAVVALPGKKASSPQRKLGARFKRWSLALFALCLVPAMALGLTEASGVTQVVPTVIRIVRGEGTLVIEASDPGVKVLIDGEQVTIGGVGVEEVRLHPGTYKLAAMRDGKSIKVDQEVVTISRNGRQLVRVLLEPEAAKLAGDLPTDGSWISLFNGKDLTGWQAAEGPTRWFVKDNILTCNGPHGFLFSQRSDFEDFHLRAVVRINSKGNSGILVGTAPPSNDLVFNGHRYRFVRKVVPWDQAKREAEALGGHLAAITSVEEDDWVRQQYGNNLPKNYTGFWLGASQATPDAAWKWVTDDSFAYTNWGPDEPNCQGMKDENQPPYFLNYFRAPSYAAELKWNDSALGPSTRWKSQIVGYLVEWEGAEKPSRAWQSAFNCPGYEAQICAELPEQPKTGSLINVQGWHCVARVEPSPVPTDTWFKLEIIARGNQFVVRVNDIQTAEYTDSQYVKGGGHIALEQGDSQTLVEFRTIELRESVAPRPAGIRPKEQIASSTMESPASSSVVPAAEPTPDDLTLLAKLDGHTDVVRTVAFLPDGRKAVSVGRDKTVRVWDLESRSVDSILPVEGFLANADVSTDGRLVATIGNAPDKKGIAQVWDLEKRSLLWTLPQQFSSVNTARFSPDGTKLVTTGKPPGGMLWDLASGNESRRLDLGDTFSTPLAAAFSPNGRILALGAVGRVRLFDVETGDVLGDVPLPHERHVNDFQFTATGNMLVCGQVSGSISVIDVDSKQVVRSFQASDAPVVRLRLVGNDRFALVTCFDATLRLLSIEQGVVVATAMTEKGTNERLAISPDGKYAITASGEDWDAASNTNKRNGDYALRLWQLPESVWPKEATGDSSAKELPSVRSEPSAFALLAAGEEQKFDTLAEAVRRASAGDTIEVRGNGPFVIPAISINQALVLRAAPGSRPVFTPTAEAVQAWLWIRTSAPLVLEGLEFHWTVSDKQEETLEMIRVDPLWPFFAAHCRMVVKGKSITIHASRSSRCEIRLCEFLGRSHVAVVWNPGRERLLRMDGCLITGQGHGVQLQFYRPEAPVDGGSVELRRNTVVPAIASIGLYRWPPGLEAMGSAVSLRTADNLFKGPVALRLIDRSGVTPLTPAEAEGFLHKYLSVEEQRNVYDIGSQMLAYTPANGIVPFEPPVNDFAAWQQFWGLEQTESVMRPVRFQGGSPLAHAAQDLQSRTPADFRLREDSAGYRAGPDGKDLGADVDLVGPGAAYERWKTTPDYELWLKETGQKP